MTRTAQLKTPLKGPEPVPQAPFLPFLSQFPWECNHDSVRPSPHLHFWTLRCARYARTHRRAFHNTVSQKVPKLLKRLTWQSSKPLGFLVPYDKEIVCRDPSQRDDEANPRAERVRVKGKGDHEETREGKQSWDEQWHLEPSTEKTSLPTQFNRRTVVQDENVVGQESGGST